VSPALVECEYLVTHILSVVEFSSQAVPQPFLDPSIIQRRIQLDTQRKAEVEKAKMQAEPSGASQDP
jgi:hypothetical protein